MSRRLGPRRPFDLAAIEALGPPPPPPPSTAARGHYGRIRGLTIWTDAIKARLRRAHAIGSEEGVVAAFPGWSEISLRCAVQRYVGAVDGPPVPFDRDAFRCRLDAMPAEIIVERVGELLAWRGDARTAA